MGTLSLLNKDGKYVENATAIATAVRSAILRNDFITLLYSNSIVSGKFIHMISHNFIDAQRPLMAMAFAPLRQRAAQALMELKGEGHFKETPNGGTGTFRENSADMIGLARETALRSLSAYKDVWEQMNSISFATSRYSISTYLLPPSLFPCPFFCTHNNF